MVEDRVAVEDYAAFFVLSELFDNDLKSSVARAVVVRIADDIAVLQHVYYVVKCRDLASAAGNEVRRLPRRKVCEKV